MPQVNHNPVIIAGAGPGGLVAALALHQRGIPVRVFESVQTLKPLGVGINLLPHSVRILHQLGLQEALERVSVLTSELRYTNKLGQLIWAEPHGLSAGYAYPQYSIHRGLLQMLLFDVAQERLGAQAVQTGLALVNWHERNDSDDGIAVQLQHANGAMHEVTGSCLIAADGMRSAARRKLHPHEGEPIYAGRILWRAISAGPPFLDGRTMIMAGHQDQKFVCYPISAQPNAHGHTLINWIAELRVPDWTPPQQDWSREVSRDRFADAFKTWQFDWLDVPALINAAEKIYEYPMVDRNPLDRWTHGRMTLLGDAAHPMYPIGSNGASQAILDADALAEQIATQANVVEALEAYEAARRPATSKIVLMNRQNGPEQVMQLAESRAPNGFTQVHQVISQQELEEISARYKQAARFCGEPGEPLMNYEPSFPLLAPLFRAEVKLGEIQEIGDTPLGRRRIIPIIGGTFTGERLSGEVLAGGADWQIVRADGVALLDARYTLRTHDGALIYVNNRGVRHGPPEVLAQLARGEAVDPALYHFRTTPTFETSAPQVAWLNNLIAICSGMRQHHTVVLAFYEVR